MNANMEQLMRKEQEGLQHWLVYEPFDKKPEQVFETSPYVQILPGIQHSSLVLSSFWELYPLKILFPQSELTQIRSLIVHERLQECVHICCSIWAAKE